MDQFNTNTYKKQGVMQEFLHSCFGKLLIFFIIAVHHQHLPLIGILYRYQSHG